ncbi:hypothetical protein OG689_02485 [Kitasatospora sp. NBC_00240]|nr:hypothetical protein [Kitasatospora sp. NBC_00240]MCX5208185.1 hypothetical protein [Kitasatospora sp. NBC_00240]
MVRASRGPRERFAVGGREHPAPVKIGKVNLGTAGIGACQYACLDLVGR